MMAVKNNDQNIHKFCQQHPWRYYLQTTFFFVCVYVSLTVEIKKALIAISVDISLQHYCRIRNVVGTNDIKTDLKSKIS